MVAKRNSSESNMCSGVYRMRARAQAGENPLVYQMIDVSSQATATHFAMQHALVGSFEGR